MASAGSCKRDVSRDIRYDMQANVYKRHEVSPLPFLNFKITVVLM